MERVDREKKIVWKRGWAKRGPENGGREKIR